MKEALKIFYSSAGFSITVLNFIVVFQIIYHRKKKQGVKTLLCKTEPDCVYNIICKLAFISKNNLGFIVQAF